MVYGACDCSSTLKYTMISVIVPIYNAETYLLRCLDSLMRQRYADFEVLLIDDGSSDSSGEICKSICKKDSRFKYIYKEHSGVAETRNKGLQVAAEQYIAFIDADDYVHQQYLEILYNAIIENECEIAAADYEEVDDRSPETFADSGKTGEPRMRLMAQTDLMAELFGQTSLMVVWGKLYKREVLTGFRFLRRDIAEDVEFNSRVYQNISKAVSVEAKLYFWVRRTSSVTRIPFSQRNIDAIDSYVLALDNMPKCNPPYRAFALQRLYKVIIYTRYNATADFKTAVRLKIRPIVKRTISEFKHNGHIPFVQKCSLLAFYYMPLLYTLFRWLLEWRTKAVTNR